MKPVFFHSAEDFHHWLVERHATARELLVGLYKKRTSRGMTYSDALDEALSFGWIDGVRKRIDDERYTIRFTPRKPCSVWSAVNIRHAKRLISLKRMAPAGLLAFRARDERKTRLYSYERARVKLDPALSRILRANRKAASFFDAQPAGYRKVATFWVMSAKKEETRLRRLAQLVERSASGARIDMLKPSRG